MGFSLRGGTSRVPDAVRHEVTPRRAETISHMMGPGLAAHRCTLRSIRGTPEWGKNKTAGFRRPSEIILFCEDQTAAVIHC